ncbi:DUF3726 domain-containing protein [Rhodobacteraceae bacterium XHP0102]|nr:DUF3726 domain-containing protein [Rhodobacteraceae bacterium XHP0102]
MQLSAGEWAHLGQKAARGAGYSWGLAEEFGASLAQLSKWGLACGAAALALLQAQAALCLPQTTEIGTDHWGHEGAPLCPITTATLICDMGRAEGGIFGPRPLTLIMVAEPVFMLPLLNALAQREDRALALSNPQSTLVFGGLHAASPEEMQHFCDLAQNTTLAICAKPTPYAAAPKQADHRVKVDPETYAKLDAYALKTTVPPSAQSRETGAGAGLSDND